MNKVALGIIDAQRGFMPAEEGDRLALPGFGELPVRHGNRIIPHLNALIRQVDTVFTTQDFHPAETAHFAEEPNFTTTWPVHCVGGTPGAELHPELRIGTKAERFYKGSEVLERGEDDTSYSGYNARAFDDDKPLPEWLKEQGVTEVILGGLALDYCVRATGLDLRNLLGIDVTLVTDATEPVAQETGLTAIDELEASGVHFETTEEILARIAATAA